MNDWEKRNAPPAGMGLPQQEAEFGPPPGMNWGPGIGAAQQRHLGETGELLEAGEFGGPQWEGPPPGQPEGVLPGPGGTLSGQTQGGANDRLAMMIGMAVIRSMGEIIRQLNGGMEGEGAIGAPPLAGRTGGMTGGAPPGMTGGGIPPAGGGPGPLRR